MIVIFSNHDDTSTSMVIKRLIEGNQSFIRINQEEKVAITKLNINNDKEDCELCYKDQKVNFSDIKSVWYRRGGMSFVEETFTFENTLQKKYSQNDFLVLKEYVFQKLGEKRSINSYNTRSINKLIALKTAKKCRLDIPDTLITSDKKELREFIKKHKNIITKAISESPQDPKNRCYFFTERVNEKLFKALPQPFFTSLFQECLDKVFEIRAFYLHKKLYSMAIFSQSDEQTSVDFRLYKDAAPNRNVPFKLPREVEGNIVMFMKAMGLNCGSLDLVYTKEKKFVFLEVNPVGQFGMVSYPCNYRLENIIANYLSK